MKKYKFYLLALFCILCLAGCKTTSNEQTEAVKFIEKCAYHEEDPWTYYFCTTFLKDENGNPTTLFNYEFNAIDLSKKLDNSKFYMDVVDSNTGEVIDKLNVEVQALLYYEEAKSDHKKISEYFNNKKDTNSITLEDLKSLDLKYVDKQILVDLYNESINSPNISLGKYLNIPFTNTYEEEIDNGILKIGYIIYYGHIKYMKIDFMYKDNGKYLSELVKNNNATKEQIQDYEQILNLERKIIQNQAFNQRVDYIGNDFSFNDIYKTLDEIGE